MNTALTPDDITAAQRCRPWVETLALIADPPKCTKCGGHGWRWLDQQDRIKDCGVCLGTGRLPVPDLVGFCMAFSDQLEEWGDPRAELVRPKESLEKWITLHQSSVAIVSEWTDQERAKRLLLLFRERCPHCPDMPGQQHCPYPGGWEQCEPCHGTGYLDLPMPVLTHGEPIAVPEEVAVCPECKAGLSLELTEWESDTGLPTQYGFELACDAIGGWERAPDDKWDTHRWWQSDWQPIHDTVRDWVRRRVRRINS